MLLGSLILPIVPVIASCFYIRHTHESSFQKALFGVLQTLIQVLATVTSMVFDVGSGLAHDLNICKKGCGYPHDQINTYVSESWLTRDFLQLSERQLWQHGAKRETLLGRLDNEVHRAGRQGCRQTFWNPFPSSSKTQCQSGDSGPWDRELVSLNPLSWRCLVTVVPLTPF